MLTARLSQDGRRPVAGRVRLRWRQDNLNASAPEILAPASWDAHPLLPLLARTSKTCMTESPKWVSHRIQPR